MNEKKYKSVIVIWGAMLLMLQALALIDIVGLRPSLYSYLSRLQTSFIAVGMIGLIIAYMILSLHKKKAGPFIGILIGILYIMTANIVNIIAGICFIIYCVWMMKELGQMAKIEKKEEIEKQ